MVMSWGISTKRLMKLAISCSIDKTETTSVWAKTHRKQTSQHLWWGRERWMNRRSQATSKQKLLLRVRTKNWNQLVHLKSSVNLHHRPQTSPIQIWMTKSRRKQALPKNRVMRKHTVITAIVKFEMASRRKQSTQAANSSLPTIHFLHTWRRLPKMRGCNL